MENEPCERLRLARERAGFETPTDAATAFGWNPVTYRSHENGTRGLRSDVARRYARALHVPVSWLLTGEGVAERENEVPIMGLVGAGAVVDPDAEQVPPDGLSTVELPFAVPAAMVGFEVRGDSMRPRYDEGDVIVCYRDQRRAVESFIGEEAAVRIADGRRYLKYIRAGPRRGTFTLDSFNLRPIEGVSIEWVGEIYVTVRAGQVRRIERALAKQRR